MKKVLFAILTTLALAATVTTALAVDDVACEHKSWLSAENEFEALLTDAEIVSMEKIGMGVTNPWRVDLKQGEQVLAGAFKPIKRGRQGGFWESYQAEIATYEIDKLLGLGMTPPTVERRIKGNKGSLQFWAEDCELYKDVMDKTPNTPSWSHQLSRMKMLDVLINNDDRNAQNFLVDPDFHIILIDHSRAFISGKKMIKNPKKLPNQFDRKLVEAMKALDRDTLDAHLKPYLNGGQIKGVLERRDFLLEHLDKLIQERGEARVLF
ncbi:MAG: hypothetical protein E2P02_12790 [Acidobacteria bacterium]|nr:MAG: hypothetical protein E2P02_12790 [Acidobacteriota bacterium]